MDVSDTVHTVRLRFDKKMQSNSEKIAPCERALRVHSHLRFIRRELLFELIVV